MRKLSIALVTLILTSGLVVPPANGVGTAGQGDTAFNANFQIPLIGNGDVKAAVVLDDGRVLAGGAFARKLLMFNSDGSSNGLSATFNENFASFLARTQNFFDITSITLLNQKIVIGGNFPGLIMMLNEDGTTTGVASEFNSEVVGKLVPFYSYYEPQGLLPLSDGSLLVAGFFSKNIMMFNANGTNDSGRAGVFNNNVATMSDPLTWYAKDMVEASNGSIIVGGGFTGAIRMFNEDGTTTTAPASVFNSNVGSSINASVRGIALDETHGAITISGEFEGKVKRLNLDGSTSGSTTQSFNAAMTAKAWTFSGWSILSNSDGSVLVTNGAAPIEAFNLDGTQTGASGIFNSNRPYTGQVHSLLTYPGGGFLLGGGPNQGLARINADGTSTGESGIFNEAINPLPDGQVKSSVAHQGGILLGGDFAGGVRMINEDGSSSGNAATFNSNVAANVGETIFNPQVILGLSSGKVLAGGYLDVGESRLGYLKMLNADGTSTGAASTFNVALSTSVPGPVFTIQELSDGRILIGGAVVSGEYPRGYIKLFNPDGTTIGAEAFNSAVNTYLEEINFVPTIVTLSDDSIVAAVTQLNWETETSKTFLIKIKADGTSSGAAGIFNENALNFAESWISDLEIESLVALADGSVIMGGSYYDPVSNNSFGFLLKCGPDGTPVFSEGSFNDNLPTFDHEVNGITVSRDGSIVVVGDQATVTRLNSDGTVNGASLGFNQVSAQAAINGGVNAAILTSDGSVVVVGGFDTLSTRNIYKFFGAGFPVASSAPVLAPQNNSQPSPPQVGTQPSPPPVLPALPLTPIANYTVIFSSGSNNLAIKYQTDLKRLVENSGFEAKYTVTASASMVRGVTRSSVLNLAKLRAARVKAHLMRQGVKSTNIAVKHVVNIVGHTLATKITVKK